MAQFPTYLKFAKRLKVSRTSRSSNSEYMDGAVKNVSLQSRCRFEVDTVYLAIDIEALKSFQSWFENDILGGTSKFKWISVIDNNQYIARIVIGSSYEAEPRTPTEGKGLDGAWDITLKIEYWT